MDHGKKRSFEKSLYCFTTTATIPSVLWLSYLAALANGNGLATFAKKPSDREKSSTMLHFLKKGEIGQCIYIFEGRTKYPGTLSVPSEIHNSSLQIVRHSTEAWIIWQCFGLKFYLKCIKSIIVLSYVNLKPCYKDCNRLKKALRTVCNYQLWLKRVEFRRARDPF